MRRALLRAQGDGAIHLGASNGGNQIGRRAERSPRKTLKIVGTPLATSQLVGNRHSPQKGSGATACSEWRSSSLLLKSEYLSTLGSLPVAEDTFRESFEARSGAPGVSSSPSHAKSLHPFT